jgi:RNA polymerase sigma-70 factor (ECF subfamily)
MAGETAGTTAVFTGSMTASRADGALLDGLARDLDGTFEAFVRAHERLVYGVVYRALGDPTEAEDAAQDAFVRAYRALVSYPAERVRSLHARAWMAQIALNCARNRRRRAPGAVTLDEVDDHPDHLNATPHDAVERRDEARWWSSLLARLPGPYRQAVELRHVHGLSYTEMAEVLERPVGTVKVHVHRGVRLLREAHDAAVRLETKPGVPPAAPSVRPSLRLAPEVSR